MIGVIANPTDTAVVSEFFELFKTPWEFYRPNREYEVLLCTKQSENPTKPARLTVIYSGRPELKGRPKVASAQKGPRIISHNGKQLPVYGASVTFEAASGSLGEEQRNADTIICTTKVAGAVTTYIGYDLFDETRTLLTKGQPVDYASIPALELHIAVLREAMIDAGIAFVEIPPVPNGHSFVGCLTHDVDHPAIRRHKLDHTMFGFLYRALVGSLVRVVRGRLGFGGLLRNWAAVLRLPLVYLGIAKDFWSGLEHYIQLEKGARSSFFVIPFNNRRGRSAHGLAPGRRASGYGAAQISAKVRELMAAGCEIGLHGIDAWRDSSQGRSELGEIRRITEAAQIGARMHWLYFNEKSPQILEEAGVDYDSSNGYNETVGYRSGTTQAYKPLETRRLLELPLHVMDTALFYPSHLDLSLDDARERVACIIDNAVRLGGCITVNWHDRSIAPERLWGDFYKDLVNELGAKGAWFATAAEAVSWFRKRRSAVFEDVSWELGEVRVGVAVGVSDDLPDLVLRIHNGRIPHKSVAVKAIPRRADSIGLKHSIDACGVLP